MSPEGLAGAPPADVGAAQPPQPQPADRARGERDRVSGDPEDKADAKAHLKDKANARDRADANAQDKVNEKADDKDDAAARRARAEWEEKQRREGERFREAMQDPVAADGATGGSRAVNRSRSEGRARFTVRGNSSVFDRTSFGHAHFGNVYLGAGDAGSAVLGEVPEDELVRLSRSYCAPDGYQTLKEVLRERRVLVVVAPPGTGRRTTALCLLEELTRDVRQQARNKPADDTHEEDDAPGEDADLAPGQVTRLDASSLDHILRDPATVAARVAPGGGFVLQLPDTPGDWTAPSEAHLGALAAALARRDAYAVLVASPSTPAGALLTGRHALRCPAAPAAELLSWHLLRRLAAVEAEAGPDALDKGERILRHPLLRQALGIALDDLRPAETDALAALVVRHLRGALTRDRLLDRCGEVARAQVRSWFAGGREAEATTEEATHALLRQAAFRVALAVLDGEAFSSVADAADLLARELLTARTPGKEPGRPVFAEDWDGLLAAARAEFGKTEDESLAGVPLPVRTVRYQGDAFAGAVLAEVWQSHHAARAPVVRWLRALADDPRPQVWVRAALVAGELCTADPGYGFVELVAPLASARSTRRRYAAATALDQAARREPYRTAVRAVVEEWAHADDAGLRWTAALTLGHGRVEPDTRTAVELLGRLGSRDEGRHLQVASYALARLAAGSRAAEALTLLGEWAAEAAGDRRDLALLTGVRLCTAVGDDYWEPESPDADGGDGGDGDGGEPADPEARTETAGEARTPRRPGRVGAASSAGRASPAVRLPGLWRTVPGRPAVPRADVAAVDAELGRLRDWPLVLAIAVTVPAAAGPLAGLLWRVFDSHLSGERALDGLSSWLRAAEQDAAPTAAAAATAVVADATDATDAVDGELLRALVWFLPLLVREERDWQRLGWVLEAMAADPGEPMDERFVGHVLDAVGAGLRGRGEGQQ
ncbi:hypothetical protein ACWD4O_19190 [Streptomyces sp. NPDC002623]